MIVVSFQDYTPASRFDGVPWAQVKIEEATTPSGVWALIDTIALVPLDTNPAVPQPRDFTTPNGTAADLWYRVIWSDGLGNDSEPSVPIRNVAEAQAEDGCTPWLTGDDVLSCCEVESASDASVLDEAAREAAAILFELSGRLFPGICFQTVRPCRTNCGCPWQVLSRGHLVWNPMLDDPYYGWWTCNGDQCGCAPLSRVLLSGYVQEVTEVLIDGVVVDPDTYRVDQHRWLVRVRELATDAANVWPGCQALDLPSTEEGTFEVTYTYGHNPPLAGVAAARELACEIYKSCAGEECKLPKGVVRLARQGVVIEKTPFASWGYEAGKRGRFARGWQTGMAAVDAFLNAYNPNGITRSPVFWSPASAGRFAQSVG